MAETFTKLFNTIITSSIWSEDDKTRILWVTMLAMADFHGNVYGAVIGLADMARMNVEDCEASLAKLMSPDKYSRTKDHDGRRIRPIEGGWEILNYARYRDKRSRTDYHRSYMQGYRAGNKTEQKNKHLDFIYLTDDELGKLKETLGADTMAQLLVELNDYIGSSGKRYKSHYHTLLAWDRRRRDKSKQRLFPLSGKVCCRSGCGLPAVYKSAGAYSDSYYCGEHMPDKVKEKYTW